MLVTVATIIESGNFQGGLQALFFSQDVVLPDGQSYNRVPLCPLVMTICITQHYQLKRKTYSRYPKDISINSTCYNSYTYKGNIFALT